MCIVEFGGLLSEDLYGDRLVRHRTYAETASGLPRCDFRAAACLRDLWKKEGRKGREIEVGYSSLGIALKSSAWANFGAVAEKFDPRTNKREM